MNFVRERWGESVSRDDVEGGNGEGAERWEDGRHRGVLGWEKWVNGWTVGGRGYVKVQRVIEILERGENQSRKNMKQVIHNTVTLNVAEK